MVRNLPQSDESETRRFPDLLEIKNQLLNDDAKTRFRCLRSSPKDGRCPQGSEDYVEYHRNNFRRAVETLAIPVGDVKKVHLPIILRTLFCEDHDPRDLRKFDEFKNYFEELWERAPAEVRTELWNALRQSGRQIYPPMTPRKQRPANKTSNSEPVILPKRRANPHQRVAASLLAPGIDAPNRPSTAQGNLDPKAKFSALNEPEGSRSTPNLSQPYSTPESDICSDTESPSPLQARSGRSPRPWECTASLANDVDTEQRPEEIATKIRNLLRSEIVQPRGDIYVLVAPKFFETFDPASSKNEKWVKIGISANVKGRVGSLKAKCKIFDLRNVYVSHCGNMRMDWLARIEKVCHAELHNFRRKLDCNLKADGQKAGGVTKSKCKTLHKEWFAVDQEVAIRTVERWVEFLGQDPYEKSGGLSHFWKERLDDTRHWSVEKGEGPRDLDKADKRLADWLEDSIQAKENGYRSPSRSSMGQHQPSQFSTFPLFWEGIKQVFVVAIRFLGVCGAVLVKLGTFLENEARRES